MTAYRRILVTGAGGFVGQHLLPALLARFPLSQLHVTHLDEPLALKGVAASHPLDITDSHAVNKLIKDIAPELTLHLAAQSNVPLSFKQPNLTWQVNLQGSLNLFSALNQWAPNSTLLFVSSSDVYGASFKSGHPLNEQALLQPLNPYAASKAAADLAAGMLAATSTLKVIRVRPFNHSGPGQTEAFVLPAFAAQIARIEASQSTKLEVGDLTAQRDFLHVKDVVNAYVQLVDFEDQIPSGSVFNICSGQATCLQLLLDQMLKLAKVAVTPVSDPARMRPSDIQLALGDNRALAQTTGWKPIFAPEDLLIDLLNDWRTRLGRPINE